MAGRWRERALGELTRGELEAMLRENETLFVEWKRSMPEGNPELGYAFAKAVASFANTLGGWVLVGVEDDGTITSDIAGGWGSGDPTSFVDRVREVLARQVDPLPPFAAALREAGDPAKKVGVVRVYESSDTPHVLTKDGAVPIRGVATTRNANGKRYEPQGANQPTLRELVAQGKDAAEAARRLLDPGMCPLIERAMDIRYEATGEFRPDGSQSYQRIDAPVEGAAVVLRVVPYSRARFDDWAVSGDALAVLSEAHRVLANVPVPAVTPEPNVSGITLRGPSTARDRIYDGQPVCLVTVAADCAGVLAYRLAWTSRPLPERDRTIRTLKGIRDQLIHPLLLAAAVTLDAAEFHGRAWIQLDILRLTNLLRLEDEGNWPTQMIRFHIPLGGELVAPGAANCPEGESAVDQLADRFRDDIARAGGAMRLRGIS